MHCKTNFKAQESFSDLNESLPHDAFDVNVLPVTSLIDPYHENKESTFSKEKLIFCHNAVLKAIDSCLAERYSDFDGHTTSNCCHGMALLCLALIDSVLQLDLKQLRQEGENKLRDLENCIDEKQACNWWIPQSLSYLGSLFLLGFIKEMDPVKGNRTVTKKLKLIGPISMNACKQIAQDLQKYFANLVAERYHTYLEDFDDEMEVSGAPVNVWGKYVGPGYIRTDQRGVKYASNLFSMQVSFAHLSHSRAKIALVNDIIDFQGNCKERYVAIFEGDGEGKFRALSSEEMHISALTQQNEPVVVYGGCVHSDSLNLDTLSLLMQPWLDRLTHLLLACDVFYPQFCKVNDDPDFDSSPISPSEKLLQTIISSYLACEGVSAADPSLYCAAHIFPASLSQVMKVWSGDDEKALPLSCLPDIKRAGSLSCSK